MRKVLSQSAEERELDDKKRKQEKKLSRNQPVAQHFFSQIYSPFEEKHLNQSALVEVKLPENAPDTILLSQRTSLKGCLTKVVSRDEYLEFFERIESLTKVVMTSADSVTLAAINGLKITNDKSHTESCRMTIKDQINRLLDDDKKPEAVRAALVDCAYKKVTQLISDERTISRKSSSFFKQGIRKNSLEGHSQSTNTLSVS